MTPGNYVNGYINANRDLSSDLFTTVTFSGGEAQKAEFPYWQGSYPRKDAEMLLLEMNHIIELLISGMSVNRIADECYRPAQEIHRYFMHDIKEYKTYYMDNCNDSICWDEDLSDLFIVEPETLEIDEDDVALVYWALLVLVAISAIANEIILM